MKFKTGRFLGSVSILTVLFLVIFSLFFLKNDKEYDKIQKLIEKIRVIAVSLVSGISVSGAVGKITSIYSQRINPDIKKENKKPIILKIFKKYLPEGVKRRGEIIMDKVKFLVAHDTDWIGADSNRIYQDWIDDDKYASAHLFCDDVRIYEFIPCITRKIMEKAWHVIYNTEKDNEMFNADANNHAIGIELCIFRDGNRSKKAYINYCKLFAYLCKKFNINPRTNITGHENLQSNKKDPSYALNRIGKTFSDFVGDIEYYLNNEDIQIEIEET